MGLASQAFRQIGDLIGTDLSIGPETSNEQLDRLVQLVQQAGTNRGEITERRGRLQTALDSENSELVDQHHIDKAKAEEDAPRRGGGALRRFTREAIMPALASDPFFDLVHTTPTAAARDANARFEREQEPVSGRIDIFVNNESQGELEVRTDGGRSAISVQADARGPSVFGVGVP